METISKFYKPERDFLYRQGAEKERAKAEQEKLDIALEMKKGGLPVAQIAKFTKLSEKEIEAL